MTDARPNIPIAAIRIDARIIVFLYLYLYLIAAMTTAERIIAHGYRRDHLYDHVLAASRAGASRDQRSQARADGRRGALFLTVRFVRRV
jgi:hypothetical protein